MSNTGFSDSQVICEECRKFAHLLQDAQQVEQVKASVGLFFPLFDVTSPRLSSPALKKFSNSSHRNRIYLKYNVLTFYSYLTIKFISSTKTHLRVVPVTKIGEGTRVFK